MSNIDWSQLITGESKAAEAAQALVARQSEAENTWRTEEMDFIADQLIAIEDGDPSALSGTEREWRDYRIEVRAWKSGALHFPDFTERPVRPA
ncbi:hypothetical protein [Pseudomonas neuropathica]|uniref:Uncharacterized protein n=1 Tax=Pseudomonas neuropathica TaxID=2730425 RepID=A0ACC7MTQ6_9PSED